MSAGAFQSTFYESDSGAILRARVQPETISAGLNPAATGPATVPGSVNINGGRRTNGVSARKIRVRWTGAAPAGYKADGVLTIAILTPDAFNAIDLGDTVTYLGSSAEVIGKTPEFVR